MFDSERRFDRRTVLKGLGGAAGTAIVGGAGLAAMSGGAAGSAIDISASQVVAETDHGEIDRVFIKPSINGTFDGFDETVGKVRILIEAKPHDVASDEVGAFAPVFRATMWLNETNISGHEVESGPGYNGNFAVANNAPDGDGHYWFSEDGVTLHDRDGPDYGTLERAGDFFDGTSVGQEFDDDADPDSFENGMYEQAGHVDEFFNDTDDSWESTTVTLRYTVSFHAPNSAIANRKYTDGHDGYDIPNEDVAEHSPLVMADAPDVDNPINSDNYSPTAIPYNVIRNHADGHPAIVVEEVTFPVSVHNTPATGSADGDSGTGGSATDDTQTQTTQ